MRKSILFAFLFLLLWGIIFVWWKYWHVVIVGGREIKIVDAGDGKFFIRGEWVANTRLWEQPRAKLQFLIPCNREGIPLDNAADMVFYAPGSNCRGLLTRSVIQDYPKHGLSVFSFEITSDMEYLADPVKAYPLVSSGWYQAIFRAHEELCRYFNLPQRKLLLTGESAGARMAQQLAATFPQHFDAVGFVGSSDHIPVERDNHVSWLIVNTWLCYGSKDSDQLAQELREDGHNVLRMYTQPDWNCPNRSLFFHTPSLWAYQLIREYLTAIAQLRQEHDGIIPPQVEWPVSLPAENRIDYFPSEEFAKLWQRQLWWRVHSRQEGDTLHLKAFRLDSDPEPEEFLYLQNFEEDPMYFINTVGYIQEFGYNVTAPSTNVEEWIQTLSQKGFLTAAAYGDAAAGLIPLAENVPDTLRQMILINVDDAIVERIMKARENAKRQFKIALVQCPGYAEYNSESDPERNIFVIQPSESASFQINIFSELVPRFSTICRVW